MTFKYKSWLLILILLCFASSTFAQNQTPVLPSNSDENTIKIDTTLVNIPIVVRDKKGALLSELKVEDFAVYENGVKQDIELFATENAPANILIMMESSTDYPGVLPYAKEVAKKLIDKIRPGDNVGLMSFDNRLIANTSRFTDNQNTLKEALEMAQANSTGIKLRNAVFVSTKEILKRVPGRKVLVLISTGNDTGSYQSERETIEQFVESDTVVYSLFYPPRFQGKRLSASRNIPVIIPLPNA